MILITGGAGFIGSHLTGKLLSQGERVIIVDNFDPYYSEKIKRKNIQNYLNHSSFTLVEGDIRQRKTLEDIFEEYPVTKVVHLAARAGVRGSIEDPFIYEDINLKGTLNLLETCKNYSIESFIFASSSSVYGNSKVPFSEDSPFLSPISPYGVTKLSGEILCQTYHHLYRIPILCIRIFTAYGPFQRPEMVVHKFTRLIYREMEVPVFGEGKYKRDYTYIDDLIEGIVLALKYHPRYDIINLGSSCPVDLSTLISLIEENIHKKARIRYLPPQPGDPFVTFADIRKAQKLLGYQPRVSIEEGIARFCRWYLDNLGWLDELT